MKKILISGATGLVGKRLSRKLYERGYQVEILVRSHKERSDFKSYVWDYENHFLEEGALDNTYIFIHLAGAPISKRWTRSYKKEIYKSRVDSAQFIYEKMLEKNIHPEAFISASAVGFYGQITSEHIFSEEDSPAEDFLGRICADWEIKALQFQNLGSRVVRIRTATVLSEKGGALDVFRKPVGFNLGTPLGTGRQYFPWIHLDDLVNIYFKAVEDVSINGAYNASAPDFVTNEVLTKKLASHLGKTLFLPNIPKFIIKTVLGEMSVLALEGSRISSKKIENSGFKFNYDNLDKALADVIN
ncbi:TIGR01777 family oxidoreductase [Epilithonimonas sp.]|uniref:TIGR01777 family oxidoreductase n=1 Tax=Epilithonimonas sp. TaxID=2894511 RepID=UPI00289DF0AE|nr:TIGR01777 family oxidoreductase [Epilithonimonas sp.]